MEEIDFLISSLDSSGKKERNEAIKKLKQAGNKASVPLLKALNSSSEQVRAGAAEVLGSISKENKESLNTFLNLLKSGSDNAKDGAARTIGHMARQGVPVYESLTALARDNNKKSKLGVALTLEYIGRNDKNTSAILLNLLNDTDKEVREQAVKSLDAVNWKSSNNAEMAFYYLVKEDWTAIGKLGPFAVPALKFGIEIADSDMKSKIASVLAKIEGESTIPLLMHLLNDKNSSVRLSAISAIAEKRAVSLYPVLVQCMNDPDPDVRVEAAWSLEKAGWKPQKYSEKIFSLMLRGNYREVERLGEKAIPSLIEFLGDDFFERRENTFKILYSLGEPGIDAIKNASKDNDEAIRNGAYEALTYIREEKAKSEEKNGDEFLNGDKSNYELNSPDYWKEKLLLSSFGLDMAEVFSKALSNTDSVVRVVAIDSLKKFGRKSSDIFLLLTDDENESIRIAAIEALGEIYERNAVSKLTEKIEDEDELIRRACAYSLGKLRDATTIPVLVRHFSDPDANVRFESADAVAKMGNQAIPHIQNMIFHPNELVRISCLTALGEISDPSGIPYATRSLNDTSGAVRNESMTALLKFTNFMFNFLMMEVHRVSIQGTKMEKLGMLSVLSKTKDMKIVPFVKEFLSDEDEEIVRNARTVLDIFTERTIEKEREKIREYSHETAELLRRKLSLYEIDRLLDRILNANDTDALGLLNKKLDQKEIDELIRNSRSARGQDTSKLLGKKLSQAEIDELLHKSVYVENKKTTQLLGKKLTQDEIDSLINHASSDKEEKVAKDIKKQLTQNEIDDIIKKELELKKKIAMEVSRLIVGLKSDDKTERKKNFGKIVKIGDPAVEPLISYLGNADRAFRDIIADILIKIGRPGIRGLIRLLNYGSSDLKILSAEKIAEIDDKEGVNALYDRIYTEKDSEVKKIFVKSFTKTSDKRVFDILNYAILDKNPEVRFEAVKGLSGLNDKRAIDVFISLFEDPEENIREASVLALKAYGKSASKPLIEALKSDKKDSYKETAARCLEQAGVVPKEKTDLVYFHIAKNDWDKVLDDGETALRPLEEILGDLFSVKRKDALRCIIKINSEKSIKSLAFALFDMDDEIALESQEALMNKGSFVLPQLRKISNNSDDESEKKILDDIIFEIEEKEQIKSFIADGKWDALERKGAGAVAYLSDLLSDNGEDISQDIKVNAVRTIGKINAPESVPFLIEALFDKSSVVSDIAKAYLIKSGESALLELQKKYESMSDLKDADAVDWIIMRIEQNERIKKYIVNENWTGLKHEGQNALGALKVLMKSKNPNKRLNAVRVLSDINSQKALLELIAALFDESPEVCSEAKGGIFKSGERGLKMLNLAEKNISDSKRKEILKNVSGELEAELNSDFKL